MTKILTTVGSLFLFGISEAQLSSTENYVYTRTYLDYNGTTASKTSETVQYFDGLGRPKQVVNVKASPLQNDIITHIEYDGFGRQSKEYLPIPQPNTMNGAIISNPLSNATQPSIYGSEKIYSEKVLENSPLDRIQQQIHVGNDWSQKPVKFDYDANIAGEVIKFTTTTTWVNNATKSEISNSGSYGTAQLYKNTVTDEDGNKTIEFKNGQGQVLLVRKVLDATQSADTYYVYNEYNQLAFVIPPLASIATLNETTLNNLCYQYRYDGRSRLVEKKLPGKGWEYMVYDKVDRLVATQDPNQKLLNKWLFTKYDKFGRVLYTGISIDNGDRNAVQTWVTNTYGINVETAGTYTQSGLQIYYANTAYPQNIESILSVNYYDSYLTGDPFPTMVYDQIVLPSDVQQYGVSTKGLPVSSFVKNIQDDNWTKTYMYYDLKGRLIREYSQNHLGGYTNIEKRIDFSGNPNIILTQHKRLSTDTEKVIVENFTYDHQNRLLTHTHQVDSNAVEYLAQNEYNELSQLKNKKVGGTSANSPLQQVDYQYNIRGWVKQINNPNDLSNGDLFGYRINYNSPSTGYWTQRYNGNISEIDWATQSDNVLRRYVYMYDSLNRLTGGYYLEPNSSIVWAGTFNENYTYDLNGNITKLVRTGKSPVSQTTSLTIDDLTYVYNGNKLNSVSDAAQNSSGYPIGGNMISYDDNGNMTNHMDKNISKIEYNHLNLPTLVNAVVGGGWLPGLDAEGPRHTYKYKANGTKYAKRVDNISPYMQEFTEVDYLDGFQYERKYTKMNTAQNPYDTGIVLKFAPTSEGYFDFEKNKYIYNYSDHLGNTRLSYFHNGSSIEVLEENNYYPFGLKHEGYNGLAGNPSYQYKYNGKELQETGMYDYGARFYMPDIGRWGVVDPLAEQYRRNSTYNYAVNNPIRFIDPDGRGVTDFVGRGDGSIYWDKNANSQGTTKNGETYLGKELTFNFTSYIDGKTWNGPTMGGLVDAAGVKLTSTLTLTGRENDAGELTSLVGDFKSKPGETPIGEPRMFYPGEGGSNNTFSMNSTTTGANINFEQHASVSKIEEYGLNAAGFKIVDVAQKLNINYNSSNGNLSVEASTNIFPSADLRVSGNGDSSGNNYLLMQYNQPSFPGTHSAPITGSATTPRGMAPVRDFSYYPSKFYKRN
ncbi:DUF6443 domain-containing protein [Chryseobacterium indoltheticum]|uniref:RHS repeat-associated core domain-containing protein n=1 Tax=Chryseobacterium indoltheticum TaxID=254 RepID=A0A3G6MZS9_9FLAO|nr:DUF6443 domain-containing protein [Chryseobacterium indoltheticum]AZA61301.1 RHS repeat-associated core domain-containing protein [Chryseobacterium indoltheticum]